MSQQEPDGPYVYQPFGSVTHKEHEKAGRLWGVGGVHLLTGIKGLTKGEAQAIVTALRGEPPPAGEYFFPMTGRKPCASCGQPLGVSLKVSPSGFAVGDGYQHKPECPTNFCPHRIRWSEASDVHAAHCGLPQRRGADAKREEEPALDAGRFRQLRTHSMPKRAEPRIKDLATHTRRIVSLRVAADYIGVSVKTLNKYLDSGLLAHVLRGSQRKIELTELAAYEERQRVSRPA